jgi:hypothetical protein
MANFAKKMEKLFELNNKKASLFMVQKPQLLAVYAEMSGDLTLDDFKQFFPFMLKTLEEKKIYNIIYDLKNTNKIDITARAWYLTNYLPKMKAATGGKNKVVIINPKSIFLKSVLNVVQRSAELINLKSKIMYADNLEMAFDLL